MNSKKFFRLYDAYGPVVIMLVVFAIFAVTQKSFLSAGNIMNVLRQVSIYGICVTGVSFVMISGGVDFSVGSQIALLGLIAASLTNTFHVPVILAFAAAIVIAILIGLFNAGIASAFSLMPLVVTMCSMLIISGLALIVTNGYAIYDMPESFLWIGQGRVFGIPVSIIVMFICIFIGWFILNRTYLGRNIYALGGNEEAARLAGIETKKLRMIVYAISGIFIAIDSLTLAARTNNASATAGNNYQFDCLTAACLGGIQLGGGNGNILKSFLGVLTIGILNNGLVLAGASTNWQTVLKGVLLLVAIILGAMSKKAAE